MLRSPVFWNRNIFIKYFYYWENLLGKAAQWIEIKGVSGIEYKVHDVCQTSRFSFQCAIN